MEIMTLSLEDGPHIAVIATEDEYSRLQCGENFVYECLPKQLQDDLDATVAAIFASRDCKKPAGSLRGIAIISKDYANSLFPGQGNTGFIECVRILLINKLMVILVEDSMADDARDGWVINKNTRVAWSLMADDQAVNAYIRNLVVNGEAVCLKTSHSHGLFEVN